MRLRRGRLDVGGRFQEAQSRRRLVLKRQDSPEEQVRMKVARLQVERDSELRDRLIDAIDPRGDRRQRVVRIGPPRHPGHHGLEGRGSMSKIARLVEREPQFVLRHHEIGLQRDGLLERRDGPRVLTLARARHAQMELCDGNGRFDSDDMLEQGDRLR